MTRTLIYPAGVTDSCICAAEKLKDLGFSLTDHPEPEITHLLLDVPAFGQDGLLRSGADCEALLSMLPRNTVVAGGNLDLLSQRGHCTMDFLKDTEYLARNAAITADCALKVAVPMLKITLQESNVLILGWGRIGKCLAQTLRSSGAAVTVAVRKDTDRALLLALGYDAISFRQVSANAEQFSLLFNTVPSVILDPSTLADFKNCIKIDLASSAGLVGSDVMIARGLPGIHAPVSAGSLIANTFFRLWKEEI